MLHAIKTEFVATANKEELCLVLHTFNHPTPSELGSRLESMSDPGSLTDDEESQEVCWIPFSMRAVVV